MTKSMRHSLEAKERAARMYTEHRSEHTSDWAPPLPTTSKIGCAMQTLSDWVKQRLRDPGKRQGPTSAEKERARTLERENREQRRANEILFHRCLLARHRGVVREFEHDCRFCTQFARTGALRAQSR
jgi:transposase